MSSTKPYSIKFGQILPQALVVILLFFFLIDTKSYYYLSLQHYFAFSIVAIILGGVVILKQMVRLSEVKILPSILLMSVWGIFFVVHAQWIVAADDYKLFYLSSGIIYFLAITHLFQKQKIKFEQLYMLFAWFALAQSGVCLLQGVGLFSSGDLNYAVKGTFNNPNTTAMYLALSTPYFISKLTSKRKLILHSLTLLVIIVALVLLKCRTAYVGLVIVSVVFFLKNETLQTKWKAIGGKVKVLLLTTLFALLCGLFTFLYFQKKASADGRLFVWKVSLEMFMQNPIKGCGYGLFEKEYNLSQAHYIQTQPTTTSEKEHARYVYMAYNDLLEHALEGGVVGFLLYASLIFWLACLALRSKHTEPSAIVLAYSAMMLINFAQVAIPVWALYLTAAAGLTTQEKPLYVVANRNLIQWSCITALLIIVVFGYTQQKRKRAQEQLITAINEYKTGKRSKAIHILNDHLHEVGTSEAYYRRYGSMLIANRQIEKGCRILEQATQYSSAPSLQFDLAYAYMKLDKRDKAMERVMLVRNMVPTYKTSPPAYNTSPLTPLRRRGE